jgi:hypothetical protein
MIRANIEELESSSRTKIHGLKLTLHCDNCGRKWAIWFRDENDLLNNLPENWYICNTCNKGVNNGYYPQ